MFRIGDKIQVRRQKNIYTTKGYATKDINSNDYITEEEITDVFDSIDRTYKCFYIKGSTELITENMLV